MILTFSFPSFFYLDFNGKGYGQDRAKVQDFLHPFNLETSNRMMVKEKIGGLKKGWDNAHGTGRITKLFLKSKPSPRRQRV